MWCLLSRIYIRLEHAKRLSKEGGGDAAPVHTAPLDKGMTKRGEREIFFLPPVSEPDADLLKSLCISC